MERSLIAVGIGLLWGGSLLAVNQVFGDRGPRANILLTGVLHVLLTMATMYAVLSTDASLMLTGVVALSSIALDLLSGKPELTAKFG